MDFDAYRKITVVNTTSEDIPAFAVMKISKVDKEEAVSVIKPDEDSCKLIIVNGPYIIPANGEGDGTIDMPFWVYYETADGTPASNEQWGTKAGSWKIHKGKLGFLTIAMINSTAPPVPQTVAVKWEECRMG